MIDPLLIIVAIALIAVVAISALLGLITKWLLS